MLQLTLQIFVYNSPNTDVYRLLYITPHNKSAVPGGPGGPCALKLASPAGSGCKSHVNPKEFYSILKRSILKFNTSSQKICMLHNLKRYNFSKVLFFKRTSYCMLSINGILGLSAFLLILPVSQMYIKIQRIITIKLYECH